MAESVDALALGASGATRESSNLSFRTSFFPESARGRKDVIAKDVIAKDVIAKDVIDKDVIAKDVIDKDVIAKDVIAKGATRDVRRAARRMPVYRFEVLR